MFEIFKKATKQSPNDESVNNVNNDESQINNTLSYQHPEQAANNADKKKRLILLIIFILFFGIGFASVTFYFINKQGHGGKQSKTTGLLAPSALDIQQPGNTQPADNSMALQQQLQGQGASGQSQEKTIEMGNIAQQGQQGVAPVSPASQQQQNVSSNIEQPKEMGQKKTTEKQTVEKAEQPKAIDTKKLNQGQKPTIASLSDTKTELAKNPAGEISKDPFKDLYIEDHKKKLKEKEKVDKPQQVKTPPVPLPFPLPSQPIEQPLAALPNVDAIICENNRCGAVINDIVYYENDVLSGRKISKIYPDRIEFIKILPTPAPTPIVPVNVEQKDKKQESKKKKK